MSAPSLDELAAQRYVSLVTFRRNGAGVPTPVWIAGDGARLYVVTNGTSAKMKRLRNNDKVRLAACTARGKVTGEWTEARARRVDDPTSIATAEAALERKYGYQITIFRFFSRVSGRARDRAFIEITA
jgi:PPOX class probable F420-dependent enzyme